MQRKPTIFGRLAEIAKNSAGGYLDRRSSGRAGERGMVLFTSLTILTVLLAVGIGIRVMLQNDYRALANLRSGTEAFYYAAAGIEWSKSELGRRTTMPPALDNRAVDFEAGAFSVAFLSPVAHTPMTASVVVRSTGMLSTSSHTLEAKLTRTFDLADAALAVRGNGGNVSLTGGPIRISGIDYDPATGGPAPRAVPRPAISAPEGSLRERIAQVLDAAPPELFPGAVPEVRTSDYLPAAALAQLTESLCASPSALVNDLPTTGELTIGNETWGTPAAPELRCFRGLPSGGDQLTLAGNVAGAGILLVKNADLVLAGAFRWEGWVVVTGQDVGLRVLGDAPKEIYGAAVVNEESSPGSAKSILEIQGALRVQFSRQGLASATGFLSTEMARQAAADLPFVITQNYWRSLTP